MVVSSSSILTSVKKTLGYDEDDTSFDLDLIIYINSTFSALSQVGVGPELGFQITDKTATWVNFLGTDPRLNFVQSYVYLKVRLLFDPPSSSFAIQAMENIAKEMEFRLNFEHERANAINPAPVPEDILDGGAP